MTVSRHKNRGFSLVEVLIATILVGMAIAALVAANSSYTMANDVGSDLSTAEFLIEQIRELTMMYPIMDPDTTIWNVLGPETGETTLAAYDDVDDFDGATFSPPVTAEKTPLTDFGVFTQQVLVQKLNPTNFNQIVDDTSDSNFVRITVHILMNGGEIASATWIRALY